MQSKLNLLFKKNLYDIAVRIAKGSQHDPEGLADIFRQYGDHLYGKGDFLGAVEQYSKTIGYLEPSYVIRRFLDSRHINFLTDFLQVSHTWCKVEIRKNRNDIFTFFRLCINKEKQRQIILHYF